MSPAPVLHATLVALRSEGRWRGVLLEGLSGAGKSGLALRLMAGHGWRLVADDRVLAWRSGERLFGRAPDVLSGLVEARGVGVLSAPVLPFAEIAACVALSPPGGAIDRVPGPEIRRLLGCDLPLLRLDPAASDAAAKLHFALKCRRFDSDGRGRKERGGGGAPAALKGAA